MAAAAVTAQLETQEWNMQEIERIQEEQARLHQSAILRPRPALRPAPRLKLTRACASSARRGERSSTSIGGLRWP